MMDFQSETTLVLFVVERLEHSLSNLFDQLHVAHQAAAMFAPFTKMDMISFTPLFYGVTYGGITASVVYANHEQITDVSQAHVARFKEAWNATIHTSRITEAQSGLFLTIRITLS